MKRMPRVNELLKRELSTIIESKTCPQLDCLLTITDVKTSPDLHHATVYVSVYGSEQQKASALSLLLHQRADIQHLMSRNVRLKYTPVLHFRLDDLLEKADRIEKILGELGLDD